MSAIKTNKKYVLSDSSINSYGFRLLTSGYLIEEFQKNPIGYYMHNRADGVILKWDNLQIEGDTVTGTPIINLSNSRGQQTVDEVNSGFLNAASMGEFVVLEYENIPDANNPGKTILTVTKWYNRECSLVDIPGNNNALTLLFDRNNNPLNLLNLKSGHGGLADNINVLVFDVPETALQQNIDQISKSKIQELQSLIKNLEGKSSSAELALKSKLENKLQDLTNAATGSASLALPENYKGKDWDYFHRNNLLKELKADFPSVYKQVWEKEHSMPYREPHNLAANSGRELINNLNAINEETNYEDISHDVRPLLRDENTGLHGALFYCEYGKYPGGMESPEITDTEAVLNSIKKNQLPRLRKLSYQDLKKEGKLKRLQHLDVLAYNRVMGYDEDTDPKPDNADCLKGLGLPVLYVGKDWDQLRKDGLLKDLKANYPAAYKIAWEKEHGQKYPD